MGACTVAPESRSKISIPCKIPSAGTTRKPFFFLIQKMNLSLMPSATRHGNHRRRADPVWLLVENDLYVSRRLASPVGIHFAADDTKGQGKSAVVAHTHYVLRKSFLGLGLVFCRSRLTLMLLSVSRIVKWLPVCESTRAVLETIP